MKQARKLKSNSRLRRQVLQPDEDAEARSEEAHRGQGLRVQSLRCRSHGYPDPHEGKIT